LGGKFAKAKDKFFGKEKGDKGKGKESDHHKDKGNKEGKDQKNKEMNTEVREPIKRTDEQKTRDKFAAISQAEKLLPKKGFNEQKVRGKLGAIKNRYKLLTLKLVVDSKNDQTATVHFTASASKEEKGQPKTVQVGTTLNVVTLSKPFKAKEKKETKLRLAMTIGEFKRQVQIQQTSLNNLTVGAWRSNWEKFYGEDGKGKRFDTSQASRDREALITAERLKVVALWMKNNRTKSIAEANEFVELLFTRQPGNKAYPFSYKSKESNGVTYINPVYGKTLLHGADQAVGGGSDTAELGGGRENFSIGAQWGRGGRARILKDQLEAEIGNISKGVEPSAVNKLKLNVVLPVEEG
jgi:hypothetical protein